MVTRSVTFKEQDIGVPYTDDTAAMYPPDAPTTEVPYKTDAAAIYHPEISTTEDPSIFQINPDSSYPESNDQQEVKIVSLPPVQYVTSITGRKMHQKPGLSRCHVLRV